MPIAPTYPGVYIEEIPSGVRTITGVPTSITAFLGTAPRGLTDEPIFITSFGDYERLFGGVDRSSMMSYAVRDFYVNGGSQAVIIRVTKGGTPAEIDLPTDPGGLTPPLMLEAASEGEWANDLGAAVDYRTRDTSDPSLFNLTIFRVGKENVVLEKHPNVSLVAGDPRYLPRVLSQTSLLLRVATDSVGEPTIPTDGSGNPVPPLETLDPSIPPSSPPTGEVELKPVGVSMKGVNGGTPGSDEYIGSKNEKSGLYALEKADLFNILCIPPAVRGGDTPKEVWQKALAYCYGERRAILVVDSPAGWGDSPVAASVALAGLDPDLGLNGDQTRNAALYFPRVRQVDPFLDGQHDTFVPCGIVAGVMARTDVQRGVWKAPAGIDASLNGVDALQVNLTDPENGRLNPAGINCLRVFPGTGRVVWGARTMRGDDRFGDEYKYLPVRRLALFLEESLYRGTQWVVFEPNDEPLWAQIRLNVGAFMQNLFRQGAFQGRTPREAYLVKCDKETTTQNDINLGIVNILVGFAPLKPAEFVIIKIQQLAGQVEV